MEILFLRIGNRIAGIRTGDIREVLHNKETIPFLPVSEYVRDLVYYRGNVIGVIDLCKLFKMPGKLCDSNDIIHICHNNLDVGIAVRKILIIRRIPKKFIQPAKNKYFIPSEFLEYACTVGTKSYPIISVEKILNNPDIKMLWSRDS